MDILQVVSGFVLGLAFIAPFFLKAKGIIKEVADLLITLSKSLEDNSISTDEVKQIVSDANELLGVFKK
jgi:hypothetical protein